MADRKGRVVSQVIEDTYELDPALGIAGGRGFDSRLDLQPVTYGLWGPLPPVPWADAAHGRDH
jgi:hypothetical protein